MFRKTGLKTVQNELKRTVTETPRPRPILVFPAGLWEPRLAGILFSGGDTSLQARPSAEYLLLSFFPPAYILGQLDDRTIDLEVFKFSENHMCSKYGHKPLRAHDLLARKCYDPV